MFLFVYNIHSLSHHKKKKYQTLLADNFTLINEYRGGRLNLCHLDAYRLQSADELFDIGFYDYLDAGWTAVVEWSEQVALEPALTVTFERTGDQSRIIRMEGKGL